MISLDTETNGVDFRHGALPFLVTTCDTQGVIRYWQWDVDPIYREPIVPIEDLVAIRELIESEDTVVLQNPKFDCTALEHLYKKHNVPFTFPWPKVVDTLRAGHLLASNKPHNLTDMCLQYLGIDISPHEQRIKKACLSARNIARRQLPMWLIASEGQEGMPSAKGGGKKAKKGVESDSPWKFDMWLPRALAQHYKWPDGHENYSWHILCATYANTDAEATLALWVAQSNELKRRGYTSIYREMIKSIPVAKDMEDYGVSMSEERLDELTDKFTKERDKSHSICVNIASRFSDRDGLPFQLEMPKGASPNDSLRDLVFNAMGIRGQPGHKAKTAMPSLDVNSIQQYQNTLPRSSLQYLFLKSLTDKRKRDSALTYMSSYRRFWLPVSDKWYRLHPSLNPTGTATLRWSCSNPNEQNISKQKGFNLRYAFGPAPGREWWSLDAKNIELRIPFYEAQEEEGIALFERPDDAPYFGSNHLLVAHILHPKEFNECLSCKACKLEIDPSGRNGEKYCQCRIKDAMIDGRVFKTRYASTLYQWVKNGNFAVQYGAIDKTDGSGTADRAYHLPGAQRRIKARFRKLAALNDAQIAHAERFGYVETIPDRSVDPDKGYPLLCTRTEWGKILPTVPLNYHVQGTAMQWTTKAMVRVANKLKQWREEMGFDGHLVMQVHDELVLDFPKSKKHPKETKDEKSIFRTGMSNLWRIRIIQKLMERGGEDIGIPTPVSATYHEHTWDEGEDF